MSLKHLIPEKIRIWLFWRRANLFAISKKLGQRLGVGKYIWRKGLPSEVHFWEEYLATKGKSCSAVEEFNFRTSPDSEFQPWLREWLQSPPGAEVQVLDVGAGPLTWVGKRWAGRNMVIRAIDPLANSYSEIMQRYGISPPVTTQRGDGEEIVSLFGREVFDLTFARNCLDHSYDAIKAVTEMIEATKVGGVIFLWHLQDEAEHLSYQGLHQWNFRLENGELLVWQAGKRFNVNREFARQLKVIRCELRDGMIEAVYRKIAAREHPPS
jgi:SAM-dependent methyltransferase